MAWILGRLYLGKILNALGIGTLIREGEFRSDLTGASVKVEYRDLFTVVTVNGCDVYFSRITGKINGVVPSPEPAELVAISENGSEIDLQAATTPHLALAKNNNKEHQDSGAVKSDAA